MNNMENNQKISVKNIFMYLGLIIAAATMLIPFLWMVSTSLKTNQYVLSMPPEFFPKNPTLDSYSQLLELLPFDRMILNSLLVAISVTIGQVISGSMAAYVFSRLEFRRKNALFLIYLATMMVPSQVTIVPLFILMRYLGWINTYQAIISPMVFTAFGTFLLRQSFLTIPKDLEEAAFIDGASHWTVFWKIIMPVSKPALATLSVFAFMQAWNAYLWPLFVTNDEKIMTLPVGLALLHGRYLTQWNLVMAGAVVTIIPMLIIYLVAQEYFVKGVVTSGIKG
ncbi:MAG: carbohydrate ABC transporter permease [Chloroflexi bacterium]|jgi:multiple sugar transport system permease protein|nr:carbohydrate ABC transporter permease [Bacteroidota bacterium]MBT3424300.1 carbohydrate ABC transporter permease [Bacteroidota bacterium]MBT4683041.1 carbohydrate ABC transporter permease [Chloroflexota bacterium]